MPERLSPEQQKIAGIILSIMLVVGAAIAIAKSLFPIFLVCSSILLIILIISFIIEMLFRERDYLGLWDFVSTYIAIVFIVALVGLSATYVIGYGIGGTSFGQACTEVYNAYTLVDEQIEQSINQLVEESCKAPPKDNCETLRTTAKTAKTLQEVQDMVDKFNTAKKVVDSVSK